MFKPCREKSGRVIGFVYEKNDFLLFFGQRHCDEATLANVFSDLEFRRIKQVHGDKLVEASTPAPEADAHWTTKKNEALLVSTADCLPVLVAHPEYVCAIHAGWRGVKNEIILKSLRAIAKKISVSLDEATVAVGPFIHAENFAVDRDLGSEFLALYDGYFTTKSTPGLSEELREAVVLPHENPEQKVYVDLFAVARAQLFLAGVAPANIHNIGINTYSTNDLASYRRDKTVARNLSFVARRK